jgi:hypothetical protein
MSSEIVIWSRKDLEQYVATLLAEELVEEPLKFTKKDYKVTRSLKANSLYRMWCDNLALEFSKRLKDTNYSGDDIHDICRHKFLGYTDIVIGKTTIKGQLISTSSLDKGEFFDFMTKVDDWAISAGVTLPRPAKSEYHKMLESQQGG